MRFLPSENDINLYEEGFEHDLLGRIKIGKSLSDLIENIEDPLVIALDGAWGTGKSHFLKRWVGAHRKQNDGKALTLYFDAFAHDYMSDPLIALVAGISERLPKSDAKKIDRLKQAAFKFIKPAARVGLALATYGATEAFSGLGDAAAEAIRGEGDRAIDDFWKHEQGRQAAMLEFQKAIELITHSNDQCKKTPIVIVIDELDRCRPDYALEILEIIKHFFAVDGVHFVLGVNLDALQNSVRVRYGSEIDAGAYLQKFLSFTFSLPDHIGDHGRTSVNIQYVRHLADIMETPNHLSEEICQQIRIFGKNNNNISIRDIGKIMSATSLAAADAQNPRLKTGWRNIFVSLIILKVIRKDIFRKMISSSLSEDELYELFGADKYLERNNANGKPNEKFDLDASFRYALWKYVIHDGNIIINEFENLGKFFDNFGRPIEVDKIPLRIYERYSQ